MRGEYSPEFLLDQFGCLGSQTAPVEQVDLDFPERCLDFPALVVCGGEFDSAGLIGIKNGCDQPEGFGCAIVVGVAVDLVLDDSDRYVGGQVRTRWDGGQRDTGGA